MFTGKRHFIVSTKLDSKAAAKKTTVTVDMDGVSDETVLGLAFRQLRVDLQAAWRKQEVIPATFEYKLSQHGTGQAAQLTPDQVRELAVQQAKASPEARAALIKQLQEMQ